MPQMKICTVDVATSGLNSFEVTEHRIMQGVVTISSKSTKYFVAVPGIIFVLFIANPPAIIKNIAEILDIIIAMEQL